MILFKIKVLLYLYIQVLRDGGIQIYRALAPNNPLSYTPATFPLGIAGDLASPFWCDTATQSGTITFGSTDTDTALLARANDAVRNAYPFDAFTADEIFVATWSMVTATGGNPTQVCEKIIMLCRICQYRMA